jgi:hypothetical protein
LKRGLHSAAKPGIQVKYTIDFAGSEVKMVAISVCLADRRGNKKVFSDILF